MKTYYRGETPKLWGVVKTEVIDDKGVLSDGVLVNPATSMQIIIRNSVGEIVQPLVDMTPAATGKFYYDGYTIPANARTGLYKYETVAKDGTKVSIGEGVFIVKEQIE